MKRSATFSCSAVLILFFLPLSLSWAQGGGGNGVTLVGAWHCQIYNAAGNPVFTALQVYHPDGTTLNTPSVAPDATAYGTWRKLSGRDYTSAFYFAIIDEGTGAQTDTLQIVNPTITVDDRNHMHATAETFILVGTDPVDPVGVIDLEIFQTIECKRLPN
jgi:hypothetical protein